MRRGSVPLDQFPNDGYALRIPLDAGSADDAGVDAGVLGGVYSGVLVATDPRLEVAVDTGVLVGLNDSGVEVGPLADAGDAGVDCAFLDGEVDSTALEAMPDAAVEAGVDDAPLDSRVDGAVLPSCNPMNFIRSSNPRLADPISRSTNLFMHTSDIKNKLPCKNGSQENGSSTRGLKMIRSIKPPP
jgi:hypothetical protein